MHGDRPHDKTQTLNHKKTCKVIAHMMPDLPNVGWERDVESFREFFENPAFRTDGLKVTQQSCTNVYDTAQIELSALKASRTLSLI